MLLDTDRIRIQHMIDAAELILQHTQARQREDLDTDLPLRFLLIFNITMMGEAASRVSEEFRAAHPQIRWRAMVGMRNRLVHAYHDMNLDLVWETVQTDVPELLPLLRAVR